MPKLVLKFEDRTLREIAVGEQPVQLGRSPDNTVVIDNPAVSGQHARLARQGDRYVLEDLQSTNGTFVNNQRIRQHTLQDGDVIKVGKHTLVFQLAEAGEPAGAVAAPAGSPAKQVSHMEGTYFIDTKEQQERLARIRAAAQPGAAVPAGVGLLTVMKGSTDKPEYLLEAQTTLIGKDPTAAVRLKGWFKPRVAAAITRRENHYALTPLAGKLRINDRPLSDRHELSPGDVLQVSGVSLQFTLRP